MKARFVLAFSTFFCNAAAHTCFCCLSPSTATTCWTSFSPFTSACMMATHHSHFTEVQNWLKDQVKLMRVSSVSFFFWFCLPSSLLTPLPSLLRCFPLSFVWRTFIGLLFATFARADDNNNSSNEGWVFTVRATPVEGRAFINSMPEVRTLLPWEN